MTTFASGPAAQATSVGPSGTLHRIEVIWRFEWAQALRAGALAWAGALAALPPALLLAVRLLGPGPIQAQGAADFWMFLLIPTLLCLLGLLLTATSAIHSEVENRTWIYLAVRPGARVAALCGKYLFAVTWVFVIAAVATLLSGAILHDVMSVGTLIRTLLLSLLSALGYGALYILIGTAFLRIGMVVAIAYTLFVEMVVGTLPAIVNRFTISYRIRSIFIRLLPEQTFPPDVEGWFNVGAGPLWMHLVVLVVVGAALLAVAGMILVRRQTAAGDPE